MQMHNSFHGNIKSPLRRREKSNHYFIIKKRARWISKYKNLNYVCRKRKDHRHTRSIFTPIDDANNPDALTRIQITIIKTKNIPILRYKVLFYYNYRSHTEHSSFSKGQMLNVSAPNNSYDVSK